MKGNGMKRLARKALTGLVAAGGAMLLAASPASAQTLDSWVGPLAADGINYLHLSTINNAPLVASSRIYTVDGNEVSPGTVGVRARLFKSGVLCQAKVYEYNTTPTSSFTGATANTCGSGSYNSHGFVAAYNSANGGYRETFTFPTNPLNWTAPGAAAPQARSATVVENGTNEQGQSLGTADTTAELPDLVAAIATNGETGYISSDALNEELPANPDQVAETGRVQAPPTVPVFDKDGVTVIGEFQFS